VNGLDGGELTDVVFVVGDSGWQVHDSRCFDFGLLDNAKPFGWVLATDVSTCNSKAGIGSRNVVGSMVVMRRGQPVGYNL